MPRLYRLDAPARAVATALGARPDGDVWPGGAVEPAGYAPVAIRHDGALRLVPRQWGVPPAPSFSQRGEHIVTHVRNLASPFWIGTLRHTQYRCLVPATRFASSGRQWLSLPGAPVFAFAGIWRDSEIPSFAILTVQDERATMPVILRPGDYAAWLQEDWKQAQRLVAPLPPGVLHASTSAC